MAHLNVLSGCARFCNYSKTKRRTWLMLTDVGFDTKNLSSLNIIPPIRRHGKLVTRSKSQSRFGATTHLDELFGQRWKTETVNFVIKRKFGDTIRSRKTQLQNRKTLVYNIHC